MANNGARTEILTEKVDGDTCYGVLEVYQGKGRLLYRVHYGSDVRSGKDDNWQPTDEDAHNMRQMAIFLFGQMIEDNPRP